MIYLAPKSIHLKEFTISVDKNILIDKFCWGCCSVRTECYTMTKTETELGPILSDSKFDKKAFLVYPNPTRGILKLTNLPLEKRFFLIDMSGKVLQEIIAIDANEITVDLSPYPAGLYFIQYQENNLVKTKKVIKN